MPLGRARILCAAGVSSSLLCGLAVAETSGATTTPGDTSVASVPSAISNGWIAFAASDADDDGGIYLVRDGSSPRLITGSNSDITIEGCRAFSPDGTRLAFGQATGNQEDGYSGDGALVITDLSADGVRTATTTIALEGVPHEPCAIWSADGRWLAFGVNTSAGEPDQVWVVDTGSDDIRRLTGLSATDLDWAPDATELAIASDGVAVYSVTSDETRPLGGAGAESVAWSPDGQTIAFMRTPPGLTDTHHDLWLMDADGTNERILVPEIPANHGRGPMWSPDGERIAYQRLCDHPTADPSRPCSEEHEAVLLTMSEDDPLEPAGTQVVIPPPQTTGPDGQPMWWYPFSVTWSPDGTALLYHAWHEGQSVAPLPNVTPDGIVAVSLDAETPPVVLSGDLRASVYSGDPWLPIQGWGRQQGG